MTACPCCLEALKSTFLGLGGRQLAGACEVCGDAVCERCLRSALVDMDAAVGAAAPRRVRARACASCVYALALARGEAPPFAEPAGSRRRAAQAACPHPRRARGMGFCPDCGAPAARELGNEDPECDACGAPSHARFNCCFACGASFGEENAPDEGAEGYVLDHACTARDCDGQVAAHMAHCPWCGRTQPWPRAGDDADCTRCEAVVDAAWAFCTACGEEAPLPERCTCCEEPLARAACAARCEECRHLVCGECFDDYTLPDAAERGELLLCLGCAEQLEAEPVAASEEASDEAGAGEDVAEAGDLDDGGDDEEATDEGPPDESASDAVASEEDRYEGDEAGDGESAAHAAREAGPSADADASDEDGFEDNGFEDNGFDDGARHRGAPTGGAARQAAPTPEEDAAAHEPVSPWEVLGVAPGTPLPEVKRAYLTLVAQYHPDKVAALGPKLQRLALEETRRLNLAWSELRERAR